jgi:hypothetical protein
MNLKNALEKIMYERVNNHSPLTNMRNTNHLISAIKSFPILLPYKGIDRKIVVEIITEQNIIHDLFSSPDLDKTVNQLTKKFSNNKDTLALIKLIHQIKLAENTLQDVLDTKENSLSAVEEIKETPKPLLSMPTEVLKHLEIDHPDYRISMSLIEVTPITKELLGGESIEATFFIDAMFKKPIKVKKKVVFLLSNQKNFPLNNRSITQYLIENIGVDKNIRFTFKLKLFAGTMVDSYIFKDKSSIRTLYFKFYVRDETIFSGKVFSNDNMYNLTK